VTDFGPLVPTGPRIRAPATTPSTLIPATVTPFVSDEDFPALAPPSVAVGTRTVKREWKERKKGKKTEKDDKEEEEEEAVKDEWEKKTEVEESKKVQEVEKLVEVKEETEVEKVEEKPEIKPPMVIETPATLAPSKGREKEKEDPPASTPAPAPAPAPVPEPSESSTKRQGSLMMRILSKDSLHSIPSTVSDTTESRPPTPLTSKPITGPALADMPLVVTKTKSALKKERLAALKEMERLEAEALAAARANDVQAPVVGRMKKKKEAKPSTRKSSDKPAPGDTEDTASEHPASDTVSLVDTTDLPLALPRHVEPPYKTPNQLISELLLSTPSLRQYEMFKPHLPGLKWESIIPPEDLLLLRSTAANSPNTVLPLPLLEARILVTPAGSVLRGLSAQQEERYLQLEKEQRPKEGWITREGVDALWKWSMPDLSTEGREERTVTELEAAARESRKVAEGYEKKCEKLIKRNRKIVGLA